MAWFVTFYSYKGGVGRTVALANTAWALASRGRRVVVVDLDLEAPSLSQRPELVPDGDGPGMVDLALGRGYAQALGRIDWAALVGDGGPDDFVAALRDGLSNLEGIQPHYVLVDSRTGFSDAGGMSTHLLADQVVLVFHPDRGDRPPLRHALIASKLPPGNDPRVDERLQRARELMPRAAAPSVPGFRCEHGEALLAGGDADAAVAAFTEAERLGERSHRLYDALARAHEARNDSGAAAAAWRKGLMVLLQHMGDPEAELTPSVKVRDRFLRVAGGVELSAGLTAEEAWDLVRRSVGVGPKERGRLLGGLLSDKIRAAQQRTIFARLRAEQRRRQQHFGDPWTDLCARLDREDLELSDPDALVAAVGDAPGDAVLLVLAAEHQADPKQKLDLLRQATALVPEAAWAWKDLTWAAIRQWDADHGDLTLAGEAETALRRRVALTPDDVLAWATLGEVLDVGPSDTPEDRARQLRDIAQSYERAVALRPDMHKPLNNWAAALIHQSYVDSDRTTLLRQAADKAARVSAIEPGAGDFNLACARSLLGEHDAAETALRSCLDRAPDAAQALADDDLAPVFTARPALRAWVESVAQSTGG